MAKDVEENSDFLDEKITRRETFELVKDFTESLNNQLQVAHVQVQALTAMLISSNVINEDMLKEVTNKIVEKAYRKEENNETR